MNIGENKKPGLIGVLFVFIFLIAAMTIQIFVIKQDYVTHITLILATVVTAIVAMMNGYNWEQIQSGILYGCNIALSFGGLLEKTRMLEVLLDQIKGLVKTTGGLVTTHVLSALFINFTSASQYMAIIIPGRMLVPAYKEKHLLPQVCSRVCEDSATVTSPLVPWGLCGVFFTSALGVATVEYFPYVFLAFLAPIISIAYAWNNNFMFKEGDITSTKTYNEV